MSYSELFKALNDNNVAYMIIGGFAVNYYGYSRMTEDLDILFKPTNQNGQNLLLALQSLGFDINQYTNHNFNEPTHFRLGDAPNSIDLINETKGIDINAVFDNAVTTTIENTQVPMISIKDLIDNKKALKTYKDLADAEMLIKITRKNHDK